MAYREHQGASPTEIAQCLGGIDFPCSKTDVVKYAQDHACPTDALNVLQNIPEKRYGSMSDVMSGIGKGK